VHLVGIRHVVLAVNKMDLVGYDQATCSTDRGRLPRLCQGASASPDFTAIPISGFKGDNITTAFAFQHAVVFRPVLIEHLETVEVDAPPIRRAVPHAGAMGQPPQSRFPRLCRADRQRHGAPGDAVRIVPSGKTSTVKTASSPWMAIWIEAVAGQSVTLTLADEVDCSAASVIAAADDPPQASDQFEATWSGWRGGAEARPRLLAEDRHADRHCHRAAAQIRDRRQQPRTSGGQDARPQRHRRGEIATDKPITFEPYATNPPAWRLHPDRQVDQCHGGGRHDQFSLRRAQNVHWQA
jgi:bifunctional enzyme CysN/CysC